jgi:hypothetical protein
MSEYVSNNNPLPAPEAPKTLPLVPSPPSTNNTSSISSPTAKDKNDIRHHPLQYYVKASFMITYILLLTTATITFVEAMRTTNPEIRHILNLETCISVVAGYFYSVFVVQLDKFTAESTSEI